MLQGAEYEVLDDSQEHWWKVKDEHGYVKAASYSTKEEQSKTSVILIYVESFLLHLFLICRLASNLFIHVFCPKTFFKISLKTYYHFSKH